ncbi:MAG: antitermination protein NusG [Pseudomonadota bacterium]
MTLFIEFLFRWFHVLAGVVWIGMLYYFNFVQGEYFKEAEAGAKADATKKLAPRALWWFRWGAMLTFITGLYLLSKWGTSPNQYITLGSLMGILMFLNVWLVIWPAQKIVIGIKDGDAAAAAPRALLASRTNVLFSLPMLWGMLGARHGLYDQGGLEPLNLSDPGLLTAAGLILLLEINGLVGKLGPLKSVVGVIHVSAALTAVIFLLVAFL